jgi:lipopolysaccharide transport system permease protein
MVSNGGRAFGTCQEDPAAAPRRRTGDLNRYLDVGMTSLKDYADSRELVLNLTLRELRSRYKRSVLGWTWSLLNPLASVVVYTIVFAGFLNVQAPAGDPSGLDSFVMFLLCGLIPWNFVSGSLTSSLDALVVNGNLIKKVYFPRELVVVSTIGSLLVTFFIELGVLGVVLLILGNMVLPWLPVVLLLVALLAAMMLGIGMTLSVLNVYFRDVKHFVNIALQILFYSAPIVYPPTLVPKHSDILGIDVPVRFLYNLNPLARFIEAFRNVLYDLRFPRLATLAYIVVWAAGMLALGMWVFGRLEPRLAEEV